MIEVIVDRHHSGASVIAALEELVLAHRVVPIGEETGLPDGTALPAIREGDRVVTGQAEIATYLLELEAFFGEWSKYQSDTCYFDEDATTC